MHSIQYTTHKWISSDLRYVPTQVTTAMSGSLLMAPHPRVNSILRVENGGSAIRPDGELLTGTIGARVANMVMTLPTFASLCAVSTDVRVTAYDACAWEGHTLRLHHLWQPTRRKIFNRLLHTWRLLNCLHLSYAEAIRLGDRRRCPVVGMWNFRDEVGFPAASVNPTWLPHIFSSTDVVRTGTRIDFDMRLRGRMPAFDVGWTTTWDLDHLLDEMDSDSPMHSFVRFRVARADSNLAPQADRGRWYNHVAMSDEAAIRLPQLWTHTTSDARLCLRIGLAFSETSMTVYINGRTWSVDVDPRFSPEWPRHLLRYVILVISNDATFRDLTLEPIPARFS